MKTRFFTPALKADLAQPNGSMFTPMRFGTAVFLAISCSFFFVSLSFPQHSMMRHHYGKEGRQESRCRASELNLTPEQRKGLEEIQRGHFRESQLLRAQLFTKQLEFREYLTDRSMKPESIRSKYSEILEIQSRFEEIAVEYLIKVRNLLTEEQLSAWCPEKEFPVLRRMMLEPMHPRRSAPPPGRFKEE